MPRPRPLVRISAFTATCIDMRPATWLIGAAAAAPCASVTVSGDSEAARIHQALGLHRIGREVEIGEEGAWGEARGFFRLRFLTFTISSAEANTASASGRMLAPTAI